MNTKDFYSTLIVERYSKEHDIPLDLSQKHFSALEQFLELASVSSMPCFPDKTIDNVWHTFIIHTKDYEKYCKIKFGRFIHHNPTDKLEQPIDGYFCFYNGDENKFEYKHMLIDHAVCDGGGGKCSSCSSLDN